VDVVMLNAGGLMTMVSGAVSDADALSVTLTVKLDDPAAVGVPEIVLPERLNPPGRAPVATDHVYGGDPPAAFSVCE
jgi:hypothetical protein